MALSTAEISERAFGCLIRPGYAGKVILFELRQHRQTAGADIFGRRIEQRAVIGERYIVEIVIFVVAVERAPAAVDALHADDPLLGAIDRGGIVPLPRFP